MYKINVTMYTYISGGLPRRDDPLLSDQSKTTNLVSARTMERSSSSVSSPVKQNDDPLAPLLGSYGSDRYTEPDITHSIQFQGKRSGGSKPQGTIVIRTYWWRWVVLAIFFLNLGMNNMVWITIAPVADVMRCYYGISNTWVNTTTTVCMAAYVIFFLPCAWFLDRYGLRATMILASVTNALGTAVRVAGTGKSHWIRLVYVCGL